MKRVRPAAMGWLVLLAAPAFGSGLSVKVSEATGLRAVRSARLTGQLEPDGAGQRDRRLEYRGELVDLEGEVSVERLTFADPAAALRYADQVLGSPSDLGGQAAVDVRGAHAVVVRSRGKEPVALLAERVLPAAWAGAPADAQRAWLGFRDPRGSAILGARRGPVQELLETLERARDRKVPPDGPRGRFRWLNAERTAFRLDTPGQRASVDGSGLLARVVQGSAETHEDLDLELSNLARKVPAQPEDAATTAAIQEGGAATEPGASPPSTGLAGKLEAGR